MANIKKNTISLNNVKIPKARQLPSGSWRIQLYRNGNRWSITEPTKYACERKAALLVCMNPADAQHEIETAILLKEMTLREAAIAYIEDRKNILSPSTVHGYRTIINTRFKSVMDRPVGKISNWQKVVNDESKLCSPKTLHSAYGFISSVIKYIGGPVPYKVLLPQVPKAERGFLEPEEIKRFVKAIEGHKFELPYLLCLHGLRRSEMLAIRGGDIKNDVIHVRKAVVMDEKGNYVEKAMPKNIASVRDVPVFIDRVNELAKAIPSEERITAYNPTWMYRCLIKVCRENNLPEVGFHELRHSFASLCYYCKISEATCMLYGGWSNVETMRRIYIHLSTAEQKKAAADLKNFFLS